MEGHCYMDIYNIFFNICLGLFIGGVVMSVLSLILAGTAMEHGGMDHIDHIDHIDHAVDHVDHIDHVDQVDQTVDHADHIDQTEHIDHADQSEQTEHSAKEHVRNVSHLKDSAGSHGSKDITPAPFMLLFSEFLLVFGISGILYYFLIAGWFQWIIFIITPLTGCLLTKLISRLWKGIAINRHYDVISHRNIIGKVGEVVLDVDDKGGVIKIRSDIPMEFEKIHAKPLHPEKQFAEGEYVYVCGKKDGYFLIDDKIGTEEGATIKFCPVCGGSIEGADGYFCENCGAKLSS